MLDSLPNFPASVHGLLPPFHTFVPTVTVEMDSTSRSSPPPSIFTSTIIKYKISNLVQNINEQAHNLLITTG